jgi:hypothetical protein
MASDSSSAVCAANRSSGAPAAVAVQGFSRTTSTWPTRCSSALIRWLTADGVTCSHSAAASKLPSSITAAVAVGSQTAWRMALLYLQVCGILIKMADGFFSYSWRQEFRIDAGESAAELIAVGRELLAPDG